MLQAALVSWAVTHVMDALLSICAAIQKITREDSMQHLTLVVALAEMPRLGIRPLGSHGGLIA